MTFSLDTLKNELRRYYRIIDGKAGYKPDSYEVWIAGKMVEVLTKEIQEMQKELKILTRHDIEAGKFYIYRSKCRTSGNDREEVIAAKNSSCGKLYICFEGSYIPVPVLQVPESNTFIEVSKEFASQYLTNIE